MLVHFLHKLVHLTTSDGQSLEDFKGHIDVLFSNVGDPGESYNHQLFMLIEAKMTEKLNPRTNFRIDCTFDYKCWSLLITQGVIEIL